MFRSLSLYTPPNPANEQRSQAPGPEPKSVEPPARSADAKNSPPSDKNLVSRGASIASSAPLTLSEHANPPRHLTMGRGGMSLSTLLNIGPVAEAEPDGKGFTKSFMAPPSSQASKFSAGYMQLANAAIAEACKLYKYSNNLSDLAIEKILNSASRRASGSIKENSAAIEKIPTVLQLLIEKINEIKGHAQKFIRKNNEGEKDTESPDGTSSKSKPNSNQNPTWSEIENENISDQAEQMALLFLDVDLLDRYDDSNGCFAVFTLELNANYVKKCGNTLAKNLILERTAQLSNDIGVVTKRPSPEFTYFEALKIFLPTISHGSINLPESSPDKEPNSYVKKIARTDLIEAFLTIQKEGDKFRRNQLKKFTKLEADRKSSNSGYGPSKNSADFSINDRIFRGLREILRNEILKKSNIKVINSKNKKQTLEHGLATDLLSSPSARQKLAGDSVIVKERLQPKGILKKLPTSIIPDGRKDSKTAGRSVNFSKQQLLENPLSLEEVIMNAIDATKDYGEKTPKNPVVYQPSDEEDENSSPVKKSD